LKNLLIKTKVNLIFKKMLVVLTKNLWKLLDLHLRQFFT